MYNQKIRILIAAGGTGGHIFPALSVAQQLTKEDHHVHWLGTKSGLESELVPKYNLPISYITINGFRGKNFITKLLTPFKLLMAVCQCVKIIYQQKPDVILGMGGFVAGPVGIAAWLMRKKLIIHEQNSIAGATNKILAKFSHTVLTAFPQSFAGLASKNITSKTKIVFTGNPVRSEFANYPIPQVRFAVAKPKLRVLVLGGSRGAAVLNQLIPKLADDNLEITHQTGKQQWQATIEIYEQLNKHDSGHKILPFIDNMAAAYANADVVICRAGALTIAELTAIGVGSILVPYPYAVDDHQTANAKFLADRGAGILLPQSELTLEKLQAILQDLFVNQRKLLTMAEQAYSLANHQAANDIIRLIKK